MNIVCATDNNFVQHCTIMIVSVLTNNPGTEVYILTDGLTEKNEQILHQEVERLGGKLHICIVDDEKINALPLSKDKGLNHISKATYYRLMISDLLPDIDKVIYLDCDIVVSGSLNELWDTDISNYAIAAVLQIGHGFEAERLGYPMSYGYFNAGVNMLNLKFFRENAIKEALFKYAEENLDKLLYNDQDILNAVLYDKCFHLLPMWNMTSMAYDPYLRHRGDVKDGKVINEFKVEKENIKEYKDNPIVLHYVSKPKPWQKGCYHPLSKLYYDYARRTIFFNDIKQESVFKRRFYVIKYRLRCFTSNIKQTIRKTDSSRI